MIEQSIAFIFLVLIYIFVVPFIAMILEDGQNYKFSFVKTHFLIIIIALVLSSIYVFLAIFFWSLGILL